MKKQNPAMNIGSIPAFCIECVAKAKSYSIPGWAAPVPLCEKHASDIKTPPTNTMKGRE